MRTRCPGTAWPSRPSGTRCSSTSRIGRRVRTACASATCSGAKAGTCSARGARTAKTRDAGSAARDGRRSVLDGQPAAEAALVAGAPGADAFSLGELLVVPVALGVLEVHLYSSLVRRLRQYL